MKNKLSFEDLRHEQLIEENMRRWHRYIDILESLLKNNKLENAMNLFNRFRQEQAILNDFLKFENKLKNRHSKENQDKSYITSTPSGKPKKFNNLLDALKHAEKTKKKDAQDD